MGGVALDLRWSAQIVWRMRALVAAVIALGVLAGAVYTVLSPAIFLSSTLVSVTPSASIASQSAVVTSTQVLSAALNGVDKGMSVTTLAHRIKTEREAAGLMSISARGETPAQAIATANAVTRSYITYASSANRLDGPLPVQLFQPATSATGTPLAGRISYATVAGLLAGVMVGVIIALAIGRSDRRLRWRDEIADSLGAPVLAAVGVDRGAKPAHWADLLTRYEPGAADAWQLGRALRELGLSGQDPAARAAAGGSSLAVLSLSRDRKALALGPQLASFAASRGIPTALVLDAQQDTHVTAALRAACTAAPWPRGPGQLQVVVHDHGTPVAPPTGTLAVIVAVVDGRTPRVASTMPAAMTVLGVGPGAVTAAQLARVSASAASDGRDISGILVADPDPADQTTGRLPQLARPGLYRMPTRTTSAVTEIRQ